MCIIDNVYIILIDVEEEGILLGVRKSLILRNTDELLL